MQQGYTELKIEKKKEKKPSYNEENINDSKLIFFPEQLNPICTP